MFGKKKQQKGTQVVSISEVSSEPEERNDRQSIDNEIEKLKQKIVELEKPEEEESEEEEPEEQKPVKQKVVKKESEEETPEEPEEKSPSIEDYLGNHEARIRTMEAFMFRHRNI